MLTEVAAYIFGGCILLVVLFQILLISGMPWGNLAMGGRYPGKLPAAARIAAGVQSGLLIVMALIVFGRAGLLQLPIGGGVGWLIWIVVVVSLLSLAMNLITPSKYERLLWAPVAFVMVTTSLLVALS